MVPTCLALDMRAIILIIVVLLDCVDSQYPDCIDCPDGE